jgi:hypothetical protein
MSATSKNILRYRHPDLWSYVLCPRNLTYGKPHMWAGIEDGLAAISEYVAQLREIVARTAKRWLSSAVDRRTGGHLGNADLGYVGKTEGRHAIDLCSQRRRRL